MSNAKLKGLKSSRSQGSISNSQHHDQTEAQKGIEGVPVSIKIVIPDSTVATPIENQAVLYVSNTAGATAFIWIGKEGDEPGTIDVSSALALPPNSARTFFAGFSDDPKKSLVVITSVSTVQIVIMDS